MSVMDKIGRRNGLPSVGSGLKEESDVSSRDVQSRHADNESDQADEDRADNVPELEESVRGAIYEKWNHRRGRQTFSWYRSELQATTRENKQENTHGGALISRVGT